MLIPLSDTAKAKVDPIAVGGSFLAYFKAVPWPELSAALGCVYLALRIAELVVGWCKKK